MSFWIKKPRLIGAALLFCALAFVVWQRWDPSRVTGRVYHIGWEVDPPFQSRGPDGQATGLAVDLVREAARRLGIRLEWVPRPESAEAALVSKSVDLWPFVTLTPQRRHLFHITEPYLETELCMLVPAASRYTKFQDLAQATISLHSMPASYHWVHGALPNARLVALPNNPDAVNSVCQGRADAVFLEEYSAVETLLSGGPCANTPLRWITVPGKRSFLGVGATFEARAAADAIRDEIGTMAAAGDLDATLGQWGYMSGMHLESVAALLNANRRETRLRVGIAISALLLILSVWQTVRIRRARDRTLRAEISQRETEQKLRLMANNLTEMVLAYDMDRRPIYANPAAEALTGYSVADLEKEGFIDWYHPEDRTRMRQLRESLFQGKSFREEEYRLVAKDGTVKWAAATWGPILDAAGQQVGVQGSERDITERKAAAEALRESEGRFRDLLENVQLAAIMLDVEGRITFCNEYVLAATGWARHEFIGRSITEFLVPEDRLRVGRIIESLLSEEIPSHWNAKPGILTKNGEVRWFQSSALVLRDSRGRIVGLANLAVDTTEHRALQEQYLQSQKMEGLGRLAGGVAHDFNNLLTVINGYSEIVFRKLKEGDPLRNSVDEVRQAGARAADLTQQLLAFSRKRMVNPRPLNLSDLIADSRNMLGRVVGEDIEIVTDLDSGPGQVLADPGQLHQVLMNLVVNARDAMPSGGRLTLRCSRTYVGPNGSASFPGTASGPYAVMEVTDTGEGMNEEVQQKIFDPFFTTKAPGEGTGLGLSTVYGIVRQAGGWIRIESQPGLGATFRIGLPLLDELTPQGSPQTAMPTVLDGCETVLVVEDQDEVRRLVLAVLKSFRYRTLEARSGAEALLAAADFTGPIHLLLTDVVMPQMTGKQLADRLTQSRPDTKVLYMSGYSADVISRQGVAHSGIEYIEKPFGPEALALKLRTVLGSPRLGVNGAGGPGRDGP